MIGFKDLLLRTETMMPFGGLKFIETETATAKPSAKPRTDDMRAMVEHMDRLGLIQRKPAAFVHQGTCFIHPVLMVALRARMSRQVNGFFDDQFMKIMRGR
jgi:hypothetical protein